MSNPNEDPLVGGTRRGDPMRWIHEVALLHTGEECLMWPFARSGTGYGSVRVEGKMVGSHRYICKLANGAPPTPKHEAAHSCGKGREGCISPGHLGWKTTKENQEDRLEHGTHSRGERSGKAKLTEDDIFTILSLKGEMPQSKLAEKFRVSKSAISSVHAGYRWSWLIKNPDSAPPSA
ncbi:hypothetical protein GGE68_001408 [Rhizobium leguminosarum]|uniref:hypothetical protein n=1 Tax=Rhizobium leguminosarum TaxID=384 RepID=UPI0016082BAE|nr:hypothetical protein [Rhizobium leguminosarum]MBB5663232.1 hypothetical protein [Rhizobium leguminosarum]